MFGLCCNAWRTRSRAASRTLRMRTSISSMAASCCARYEANSCCKAVSLRPARGLTRSRPGTVSGGAPWRTQVNVKARPTAQSLLMAAKAEKPSRKFIIVTQLFTVALFPAPRPRSGRIGMPTSTLRNWCATGRLLASAPTLDQQRSRRLSAASAAEIVGCYPKSARMPTPGQVAFMLAASRFGMTARGATELQNTILPSLR